MNNGRRYSKQTKEEAMLLRKNGLTHREIAEKLGTSWSIVHLWTRGIALTSKQKESMIERRYKITYTDERRKKLSIWAKNNLAKFWKKPYSKKDLLNKIYDFYLREGRIPLKREFNMYGEYQKLFGSWNNAIKLAGFEPNQVVFSKRYTAKDNHVCDSFAEKIIDDWLFKNKIEHKKNYPYQETKMTADFAVGRIRIEYFGLAGSNRNYDLIINKKRKLCEAKGLKLIEIYPSELFSKDFRKCLSYVFKEIKT